MDLKQYLKDHSLSAKRFSEIIGVSPRTVEGWCAGRPLPGWVPVVLRRIDYSSNLAMKIDFFVGYSDAVRSRLLCLRSMYSRAEGNPQLRNRISYQMDEVFDLWRDTYPILFEDYNLLRDEFKSLLPCEWRYTPPNN